MRLQISLRESFNKELEIKEKTSRTDLVTNMDREIELFLYEKITAHFPDERILGEESVGHDIQDLEGIVWIIDPIDGTLNFIKQRANFAIMIGIYEDGVGHLGYIYDVVRDELYFAIRHNGAYCNDRRLPTVEELPLSEGFGRNQQPVGGIGCGGSAQNRKKQQWVAREWLRRVGNSLGCFR